MQVIEGYRLNKNYRMLFKIAMVGDVNVGKTTILKAFKTPNIKP